MKYGIILPTGDARTAANFAHEAEAAGWNGFFVWEPVWGIDAWVCLTVAAMTTESIRLGTMITPLSRMRPWKLASETATLDNLSKGRVILAVGLGAVDTGFAEFGEVTDRKTRAELLDEGLDILTGLWRGQPFNYNGKHYKIKETKFHPPPPPVQKPRIPIWVVGAWPRRKSMRRVLRCDGLLPAKMNKEGKFEEVLPADVREMKAYVDANHTATTPFDIVVEGKTAGLNRAQMKKKLFPWFEAGVTWWMEAMWDDPNLDHMLARVKQGPPSME